MTIEGTTPADWLALDAAASRVGKSRRTIERWITAGYVRSMMTKHRVFVIMRDVAETEQAIFDGITPTIRD